MAADRRLLRWLPPEGAPLEAGGRLDHIIRHQIDIRLIVDRASATSPQPSPPHVRRMITKSTSPREQVNSKSRTTAVKDLPEATTSEARFDRCSHTCRRIMSVTIALVPW